MRHRRTPFRNGKQPVQACMDRQHLWPDHAIRNWVQPSREIFWPVLCSHLLPATSACSSHLMFQRNAEFHPGPPLGTAQTAADQQQLDRVLWELTIASSVLHKCWQPDPPTCQKKNTTPLTHLSISTFSETLWHQEYLRMVTWTQTSDHTHHLLSTSPIFQAILKQ